MKKIQNLAEQLFNYGKKRFCYFLFFRSLNYWKIKFFVDGIKKRWNQLSNQTQNYIQKETQVSKEMHQKILRFIGLPEDIDVNRLGNYYKSEYKRYKYFFSRPHRKNVDLTKPSYHIEFNNNLKLGAKKMDDMVKFLQTMRKNENQTN